MVKSTYGQLVIGPPGSGKTTYCQEMAKLLLSVGRKVAVIDIDPANDTGLFENRVSISELITVEDVMKFKKLGPNGGLVYCMEYLEQNIDWLFNHISKLRDHYLIFDCPGQIELYTHHNAVKKITQSLCAKGINLCCVSVIDSHYCSDPGKFISALLVTLSSMLHMELPHINIISKVDVVDSYSEELAFSLDFYTDVMDLNYLLECLQDHPLTAKYKKLNSALVSLIQDYNLVSFLPLNVKDKHLLVNCKQAADKANGYIYNSGEEQNISTLLSTAIGVNLEEFSNPKV